jgi:PBP1b-binding outer membrane lipoprotein LpoB
MIKNLKNVAWIALVALAISSCSKTKDAPAAQ